MGNLNDASNAVLQSSLSMDGTNPCFAASRHWEGLRHEAIKFLKRGVVKLHLEGFSMFE